MGFQFATTCDYLPYSMCNWTETVLYRFSGGADGEEPSGIIFDQAGSLYGTTVTGGLPCRGYDGCGVIFKLTPSSNGWRQTVIYEFTGGADGANPVLDKLVFDQAGNLYGTASAGGDLQCHYRFYGCGTVFQVTSAGVLNALHTFQLDDGGVEPFGGLIFDQSGNLYGSTSYGGSGGGGTVFMLSSSWTFNVLYSFTGSGGSEGSLKMDASGNLYGTTVYGGAYGSGTVFKLSRSGSGWVYTSLHDFAGGSDGEFPIGGVVFDDSGNLYGTAYSGGSNVGGICSPIGCGIVWEITP